MPVTEQGLLDRLARAELLAGLTEVQGPGLVVTLRNCPRAIQGADPTLLRIQDRELNAVLNALRVGGAEALAVQSGKGGVPERILATSAARDTADGVLLNGTRLVPPYRLLAVGSAEAMRAELLREDGVVKKNGLDTLQMFELVPVDELSLPAFSRAQDSRFARVPETVVVAQTLPSRPAEAPATQPIAAPGGGPEMPAVLKMPDDGMPRDSGFNPALSQPPTGGPKIASVVRRPKNGTAAPTHKEPEVPMSQPKPMPGTGVDVPAPMGTAVAKVDVPSGKSPAGSPRKPVEKETVPDRRPVVMPRTPPTIPASVTSAGAGLFGGKGLAKYHTSGCRFGERIEKGDRVLFDSTDAAKQGGRVPCTICLGEGK
jgi:hypothetical protein